MGKRARLDRRSKRHIKVDDAATLIAGVQFWVDGRGTRGPGGRSAREVATAMMTRWGSSAVVMRVDADFAAALIDSHTDVALVPDWLDRFPFNAVASCLAEPLSLHDGTRMCHYMGMIVTGIRAVDVSGTPLAGRAASSGNGYDGAQLTYYVDIPGSNGVRCLWVYQEDGDPRPRLQTLTFQLRGELADQETTLKELIDNSAAMAVEFEQSLGQELPALVTLSLSLLLYMAATDPDLDWPPAEHIIRPNQLKSSQVGNLGWRTGAALRRNRVPPAAADDEHPDTASTSGRRLPAHIRKAHWHRVRVAERDALGNIYGSLQGTRDLDWHYELRWYPPTAVNAGEGVNPTVRDF